MREITTISLPKTILAGLNEVSTKEGYRISLLVFQIAFDVLKKSIEELRSHKDGKFVQCGWEKFLTLPYIGITRNFDYGAYVKNFFQSYKYTKYQPYQYHENIYHESWEDEESYDTEVRIIVKKDFTIAEWDEIVPEDEVIMIVHYVDYKNRYDDDSSGMHIYLPDPNYRIGNLVKHVMMTEAEYNVLKRIGIV